MRTIEWDDRYSVGIAVIDEDHKAFFDIAEMINCMESHEEILITSCFRMLKDYVCGHFYREELAMDNSPFMPKDEIERHKSLHHDFKNSLDVIISEYESGNLSIVDKLPELVSKWLVEHISTEDINFDKWLSPDCVDTSSLVVLAKKSWYNH